MVQTVIIRSSSTSLCAIVRIYCLSVLVSANWWPDRLPPLLSFHFAGTVAKCFCPLLFSNRFGDQREPFPKRSVSAYRLLEEWPCQQKIRRNGTAPSITEFLINGSLPGRYNNFNFLKKLLLSSSSDDRKGRLRTNYLK